MAKRINKKQKRAKKLKKRKQEFIAKYNPDNQVFIDRAGLTKTFPNKQKRIEYIQALHDSFDKMLV